MVNRRVVDPFNRITLYSLLARRRVLEEFMKDQFTFIGFLANHLKKPADAQRMIEFVDSLDLNDLDRAYTINLIAAAIDINVQVALKIMESKDE